MKSKPGDENINLDPTCMNMDINQVQAISKRRVSTVCFSKYIVNILQRVVARMHVLRAMFVIMIKRDQVVCL